MSLLINLRFQILKCATVLLFTSISLAADEPADMVYPFAAAVDSAGVVYVVDRDLPGIWKIADGERTLLHQASKKLRTPLNVPRCAAVDPNDELLVGCSPTRDVYRVELDKEPKGLTGGGANGIGVPIGIVASQASTFVADLEQHCVWSIGAKGERVRVANVPAPRGLAMDSNKQLWVVSGGQDSLYRIDDEGKPHVEIKGRKFRFPTCLVVHEHEGNMTIYVSDTYSKAIWRVVGDKVEKWFTNKQLLFPAGLALDKDSLIVADPKAKAAFRVTFAGEISTITD